MSDKFDVLVLGLGAAGSSALYHLSKTGKKVCGIDQFSPPHSFGSSHGQSRITRQAYHENPLYVPFIMKAYKLWDELEEVSGRKLFLKTGGIMLGSANAGVIKGAELSAKTHNIAYEYLENKEITKRFPALKTTQETVGVLEKNAGILFPEECIAAHLELAARNGASIKLGEKIVSISHKPGVITVTTTQGQYETEKLVVAAGAWTTELLPELKLPLTVERQVLYWFKQNASDKINYGPQNLPVYIWEYAAGKMFYGFPDLGDGIKLAHHHTGELANPNTITKDVSEAEVKAMTSVVKEYFNINPVFNYATTCMYTNTPDEDFIIDHHPDNKDIIVASPCSGHGFKFASIVGEILSDLAQNKSPELDISMFRMARF